MSMGIGVLKKNHHKYTEFKKYKKRFRLSNKRIHKKTAVLK